MSMYAYSSQGSKHVCSCGNIHGYEMENRFDDEKFVIELIDPE